MYKICQIVLILGTASRGKKSSLVRLQLFNWALKRTDRQSALAAAAVDSNLPLKTWGFDPALTLALKVAEAEALIEQVSLGYKLADKGESFLKVILGDKELLTQEKRFLKQTGMSITETKVSAVSDQWATL